MSFSERLKTLRDKKGFSQAKLADELGVSKSTISMYELGAREPDFETLEMISDYFNVDMNYLLGDDDRSTYYLDPEAAEIAQQVYERPELKMLFDATSKVSKEDLELVISMVDRMKKDQDGEEE